MNKNKLYKDKIYQYAKDIIETEGLDALTVSKLVNKCNISKRTFYEVFPSKKVLLEQLQQENQIPITDEKTLIFKKAREIIAKKSFSKIDMSEIAMAAGMNRGTLYKYFKSREQLLEYCIEKENEMIIRTAGKVLSDFENPVDALENYITGFCQYINDPYPISLFSEAYNQIPNNKKIEGHSKDIQQFFINSFKTVLEIGIVEGFFYSDIDVENIAVVVLAALNGLDLFSKTNPSLDIQNGIKDSLLTLLFNTILIKKEV